MPHILGWLLLLCLAAAEATDIVRIRVSKPLPTSASNDSNGASTTSAPTLSSTLDSNSTTSLTETSTALASDEELDSTSTTLRTTFPDFVVPTLPTKKTKTYVRTTVATTTSSTTTSSTTETPTTTELPDFIAPTTAQQQQYCACNLHAYECDINCCCDVDCPAAILKVFNCHAPAVFPELRERFADVQYQHGLPSCKLNDGWLCVFRTNIAPAAKEQHLRTNFDTSPYFKWPDVVAELASVQAAHETSEGDNYYTYGNALWLLNVETRELQQFVLPAAFRSAACNIKQAVRHLVPQQRNCLLTGIAELQQQKEALLIMAADTKLLSAPQRLAASELSESQTLEFKFWRCVAGQQGATNCAPLLLENDTFTTDSAGFYATKIMLHLSHNYTHILNATIEFHEQQLNASNGEEVWLTFHIQYNSNDTNSSVASSGPLGYLQGDPIITAQLVANNASEPMTPHNQVLDYFQPTNITTQALKLFTKRQSFCYSNNAKEHAINFGINEHKTCTLRLDKKVVPTMDYNFTRLCSELQAAAWTQLFREDLTLEQLLATPLYISQLGRPQNNSDTWLPLELPHAEAGGLPAINAEYHQSANTFVCRNILLSLTYEFQIGTFRLANVEHEALITHAALILGPRLDLEFSVQGALELPLTATVMFYDHVMLQQANNAAMFKSWLMRTIYILVLMVCSN